MSAILRIMFPEAARGTGRNSFFAEAVFHV